MQPIVSKATYTLRTHVRATGIQGVDAARISELGLGWPAPVDSGLRANDHGFRRGTLVAQTSGTRSKTASLIYAVNRQHIPVAIGFACRLSLRAIECQHPRDALRLSVTGRSPRSAAGRENHKRAARWDQG
jgi:hypothetical protein